MWSPMLTSLGASSCAFCPSAFSAFPSDSFAPSFSSVPGFFDPEEKVEGAVREKERSGGMERERESESERGRERGRERESLFGTVETRAHAFA